MFRNPHPIPDEGTTLSPPLPASTVFPLLRRALHTPIPAPLPTTTAAPGNRRGTAASNHPKPAAKDTEATSPPPKSYLYLTGLSENALTLLQKGQALGNRANVFSKVGDSITAFTYFLTPIGIGRYNLREYAHLQPAIDYFSQAQARTHNSFANVSLAAQAGWPASRVVHPGAGDPRFCEPHETPLACEYRLVRPSFALIMLGSNDVPFTSRSDYERALRRVLETTLARNILPILSTIPPQHLGNAGFRVAQFNAIITALTREYSIPLWDYWSALRNLPNEGLSVDGVHPSWVEEGHNADFTLENLQYGIPVRNLTALEAISRVWKAVGLEASSEVDHDEN